MISIIIPNYNSAKTIGQCLESVYNSNSRNFEVIVVDDGSADNSTGIIDLFPCKLIKLNHNKGPANSRNIGVKHSKGNILLFLDSDIIINKNTIKKIHDIFNTKKDIDIVYGYYDKNPVNTGFFQEYAALNSYHIQKKNFRDAKKGKPLNLPFQASIGAIKKKRFVKSGGFNTQYKGADIEDDEFGYILKHSNIYLDPELKVMHYFKDGKELIRNHFKRAGFFTKTLFKYKKPHHAFVNLNQFLKLFFGLVSFLSISIVFIIPGFIYITLIFLSLFLILNVKFYNFILREKGFMFLSKSILFNYFMYIVLSVSIIHSMAKLIKERVYILK